MIIGLTTTFFIVVIFNEMWILSVLAFAPSIIVYAIKTGQESFNADTVDVITRCIFVVVLYAIVAYKCEIL